MRLNRRSFLGASAAAIASASLSRCSSTRGKAVVIGSGFGGSISALRLAEAGIETIVLERGQRWAVTEDESTFPSVITPDRRAAWFSTNSTLPGGPTADEDFVPYAGLLERIYGDTLDVMAAAGVGGGSLVFGGIMLQPDRPLFERVFGQTIDYEEMDRVYYPRVREMMRVASIPDDLWTSEHYLSARVFFEQAERAGLQPEIIQNAIDWDLIRAEVEGKKKPSAIVGDYNYGLNSGAKNSLDRTYLPAAEATGFVEVRPLHWVRSVAESGDGFVVEVDKIDPEGAVMSSEQIQCDYLFMAAGTMGTMRLLLKAKAEGQLTRLGDGLGTGWGNNGQIILTRSNLDTDTGAYQGGPPVVFVRDPDNPVHPVSVEHGPGPIGFECQCLISIGHGIPDGPGGLLWNKDKGDIELRWTQDLDRSAREAFRGTLARMNGATGETIEFPGLGSTATYHPLGGAIIGEVCDLSGRVKGYDNLFVMDGSLVPGSTGTVNPALTIGALAERCLERAIDEL